MRQLNVHRLVKDLNKLCNELNDKYHVNCGGCCYVAYEIAKQLDKLHIKYQLCILDENLRKEYRVVNEVLSKVKRNECNSITGNQTCNHYYLRIEGGGPINKGSFFLSDYYTYIIPNINYKNIYWIYKTGYWNDIYNRNNNKLIKKIIHLYFKQYGTTIKSNLHSSKSSSMPKMSAFC